MLFYSCLTKTFLSFELLPDNDLSPKTLQQSASVKRNQIDELTQTAATLNFEQGTLLFTNAHSENDPQSLSSADQNVNNVLKTKKNWYKMAHK